MKIDQHTVTHAQLFKAMAYQLITLGMSAEECAGYLLAEQTHGSLRPNAPQWLMRSTLFRIERGESPNWDRRNDLLRICKALDELNTWQEVAATIDGY